MVGQGSNLGYFPTPAAGELRGGRGQRRRTEVKRIGAQGLAYGATGVGLGTTASRVLDVPIHGKRVGTRGAVAIGLGTGATAIGARTYARWKKDEIAGISEQLGRGNAARPRRPAREGVAKMILRIPSSELDTFAAAAIYVNSLNGLSKRERRALLLQQYKEGLVKPQLLGLRKSEPAKDDRRARQATAALSAVGAGAGAYGLGVGVNEVRHRRRTVVHENLMGGAGWPGAKRGALRQAVKRTPRSLKLLVPLEAAGLGGEISATHILHNDSKKMKEPAVAKSEMSTTGVFERVSKRADGEGRNLLEEETIEKRERRYDPEADRQRRLGTYAGAGIGGAGILGTAGTIKLRNAEEKSKRVVKVPKFKANRAGYLLAAGGAASGLGGLAAYKRGISERNRPWN